MADNFQITQGSGTTIAAHDNGTALEQKVQVTAIPLPSNAAQETGGALAEIALDTDKLDVLLSTRLKPGDSVNVGNFPATQPVSIATMPSTPVTGPLTDTQLRATPVPISGTVTSTPSGTQTVTGTVSVNPLPAGTAVIGHVIVDTAPTTPVTGTFFQVTQPVSAASLPLPSGAATSANQTNGTQETQVVDGSGHVLNIDPSGTARVNVVTTVAPAGVALDASLTTIDADIKATQPRSITNFPANQTVTISNPILVTASQLCVTATAATGVAVTATLPAVAANFHYITLIEITKYFTVANAASATPLVVTTTNLPGSYAITFGQPLGTIGTTDNRVYSPSNPLRSSVLNTATTIVCPATTGIIWRVNVYYFTAA